MIALAVVLAALAALLTLAAQWGLFDPAVGRHRTPPRPRPAITARPAMPALTTLEAT